MGKPMNIFYSPPWHLLLQSSLSYEAISFESTKPLEDFNHIAWFPIDEAIENSNVVAINGELKLGKSSMGIGKNTILSKKCYNRVRKSEELL